MGRLRRPAPHRRRATLCLAPLSMAMIAATAGITAAAAQDMTAEEPCRQALALGLDVSGSVDAEEWQLQINGLARALGSPDVARALFAMEGAPVWLAVYEWAGDSAPRDLVTWTALRSPQDVRHVQAALRAQTRVPHAPGTAMGAAMQYGGQLLAQRPACWRHTLDISADGRSNMGPRPERVRLQPELAEVTINGLIVSTGSHTAPPKAVDKELAQLSTYFQGAVIQGFGAFVEPARSYADYERAMTQKLLKELQTVAIGWSEINGAAQGLQR